MKKGQKIFAAKLAIIRSVIYGGICIWLEDLYIKPDYRHSGISGKVFEFIENHYPNAVRFKLEVEPENEFAVKCYQKQQYKILTYSVMSKEKN